MSTIRQQDFIDSIEDALQYISFYHPLDFVQALEKAYEKEQSKAAKDAIAQILINSRMSAEGKRPLCQDTGIVTCFVKVGMDVKWDNTELTVQQMVDEGTAVLTLTQTTHYERRLSPTQLEAVKTPKTTPRQ